LGPRDSDFAHYQHELGLTLGGLFPQDRGTAPNTVRLKGGTPLQANYGYRILRGSTAALYAEVHFLANEQPLAGSGNTAAAATTRLLMSIPECV
jgi:hypothetical protein